MKTNRALPAFASIVVLVACTDRGLTDIEIVRRYCILKGDTIGVLIVSEQETGIITQCVPLIAKVDICDTVPVVRHPSTPCVVGKKAA